MAGIRGDLLIYVGLCLSYVSLFCVPSSLSAVWGWGVEGGGGGHGICL